MIGMVPKPLLVPQTVFRKHKAFFQNSAFRNWCRAKRAKFRHAALQKIHTHTPFGGECIRCKKRRVLRAKLRLHAFQKFIRQVYLFHNPQVFSPANALLSRGGSSACIQLCRQLPGTHGFELIHRKGADFAFHHCGTAILVFHAGSCEPFRAVVSGKSCAMAESIRVSVSARQRGMQKRFFVSKSSVCAES